jgi:hypothetical protein
MLAQIITENGQKKIKPLTADAGAGNPVGTIIVVCSNQIPSNYLPLGTQYDTSLYPVLYALLGTDTTPTASALGLPTLTSGQYAIKATSGLTENQQENVLNTINDNLSYSTTEHNTGKKWIDGKMIYERVIMCSTALTFTPNQWTSLVSYFSGMTDLMAVIDTLINAKIEAAKDTNISNAFESVINSSAAQAKTAGDYTITATGGYISVEYTKTV